jgi:hypothetical protein
VIFRVSAAGLAPAAARMSRPFASSVAGIALAGGVVASSASPARADTHRTTSLRWVETPGAEACGGESAIAAAIAQRLGPGAGRDALVSPDRSDVSIEARAARSGHPPVWRAVMVLRDRDGAVLGTREFTSTRDDCTELRASVALAAALMIDPDAALRPAPAPAPAVPSSAGASTSVPVAPSPATAPPLATATPPATATATPPASATTTPKSPPDPVTKPTTDPDNEGPETPATETPSEPTPPARWGVTSAASFALGFGVLPSPAVGLHLDVTVSPPRFWALEAFGGFWGDQTVSVASGAQIQLSLPYAGLALCPVRLGHRGTTRFSVCAGSQIAFLSSHAQGFSTGHSSLDPGVDVVVPLRLFVPVVSGVGVSIGGELGLALLRDRFTYDDAMGAHQALPSRSLLNASSDLGVSVALP